MAGNENVALLCKWLDQRVSEMAVPSPVREVKKCPLIIGSVINKLPTPENTVTYHNALCLSP